MRLRGTSDQRNSLLTEIGVWLDGRHIGCGLLVFDSALTSRDRTGAGVLRVGKPASGKNSTQVQDSFFLTGVAAAEGDLGRPAPSLSSEVTETEMKRLGRFKRLRGFTLIELLVVVAIIALLISILLPSLSRARELSKRTVCSANLRGWGSACKIYSNENDEYWPTVETTTGDVKYTEAIGGPMESDRLNPTNRSSGTVSTTRNFWMLIREGDVTVKLLRCPSSNWDLDDTENLNLYYDFRGQRYVSYGYQIPYPSPDLSRPTENQDPRMAFSADRGWASGIGPIVDVPPAGAQYGTAGTVSITKDTVRSAVKNERDWDILNSPNHNQEGQNILFQDGHVDWTRTFWSGINFDNIYTNADYTKPEITFGTAPEAAVGKTPGENSLGSNKHSNTDSFIYP
jgi:prepilin-type N-terminal cleavage/methylation domain-containing protein/prepilin-type processing-associated H-X9-DG protein